MPYYISYNTLTSQSLSSSIAYPSCGHSSLKSEPEVTCSSSSSSHSRYSYIPSFKLEVSSTPEPKPHCATFNAHGINTPAPCNLSESTSDKEPERPHFHPASCKAYTPCPSTPDDAAVSSTDAYSPTASEPLRTVPPSAEVDLHP